MPDGETWRTPHEKRAQDLCGMIVISGDYLSSGPRPCVKAVGRRDISLIARLGESNVYSSASVIRHLCANSNSYLSLTNSRTEPLRTDEMSPISDNATDRTPLISSRKPKTTGSYLSSSQSSTFDDSLDDAADCKKQEEEPQFNLPGITQRDFVLILTGLWSATFLGSLDGTIVATLLTDIGTSFEKSNMASWLGTSYLLSVCCFTPIYGRLCDIIGRRGAMMTALTFFGIGTIGCGIAPSMETLILARAIAGAGGGAMMSVGSIIVTDLGKH
jgi:hypothetical protein